MTKIYLIIGLLTLFLVGCVEGEPQDSSQCERFCIDKGMTYDFVQVSHTRSICQCEMYMSNIKSSYEVTE